MNALVSLAHQRRAAAAAPAPAPSRRRARTGAAVAVGAAGDVTISRSQRNIHVASETIAVLVAAPFSIWLATRETLPNWARALSGVIGIGTLAIDGGLLVSYMSKNERPA